MAASGRPKEFMNIQNIGAPRRAKLSLPFGGSNSKSAEPVSVLSGRELRRIVADMIG